MNTTNADTNRQSPNLNVDGQLTKQDPEQPQLRTRDRSASIASSLKSARRRSLPSRTSMISFSSSELSISTVSSISSSYTVQQANEFQQRRRRAAKLAQFFGVNYRELVNEVLESIESGVAQEHQRGTLRAEEVEVCCLPPPFFSSVLINIFSGSSNETAYSESKAISPILNNIYANFNFIMNLSLSFPTSILTIFSIFVCLFNLCMNTQHAPPGIDYKDSYTIYILFTLCMSHNLNLLWRLYHNVKSLHYLSCFVYPFTDIWTVSTIYDEMNSKK